jgi:twinkle protein
MKFGKIINYCHIKNNFKFNFQLYKIKFTTFVSKYNNILNPTEIFTFLNSEKLIYRTQGDEIIVKECPLCHNTKNKINNFNKLYISKKTGQYICHRCGVKGY